MTRYYCIAERPWMDDADLGGYWGLPQGAIGAVDLAPIGSQRYVFATSDSPFDANDVAASLGDGTRLSEYIATPSERSALQSLIGVSWVSGWTLLDWLWSALADQSDPDGELRAKPIMPTHHGVLELHLGGHSLIRSQRIPSDPTTLPSWPQIQRVLQNDYRKIRESARSDHRLGELHKKWLGAQQAKYRLTPEAARDLIGDRRDGLPLRPTTTITDNFNRTNSNSLGSSSEGWSWSEPTGDYGIRSNAAEVIASGRALMRADSNLSSDDHYTQVDLVKIQASTNTGPCTRMAAASQECYTFLIDNNDGSAGTDVYRLFRISSAGSLTLVDNGSSVSPPSLPATAKLESDGSSHTCSINGTTVLGPLTDSNFTGSLRTGNSGGLSGSSTNAIDNFEAADLIGGGTVTIPPPLLMNQRMIGC